MRDTSMQDESAPLGRPEGMTSTIELLDRFKRGDEDAISELVERSIPPLKRWARGRLPQWARSLAETQDLVQNAVLKALPHLKTFEAEHPGALQAYLRRAVDNHIKDEIRKVKARPVAESLSSQQLDEGPSPLEVAIGREGVERYEAALKTLRDGDQQAIIARYELQQSYEEIAIALGKPSADAARMAVIRAIQNLLKSMAASRPQGPGLRPQPDTDS
jgi:RNA polymerase sigma-70 factor (ECF subfamily)